MEKVEENEPPWTCFPVWRDEYDEKLIKAKNQPGEIKDDRLARSSRKNRFVGVFEKKEKAWVLIRFLVSLSFNATVRKAERWGENSSTVCRKKSISRNNLKKKVRKRGATNRGKGVKFLPSRSSRIKRVAPSRGNGIQISRKKILRKGETRQPKKTKMDCDHQIASVKKV